MLVDEETFRSREYAVIGARHPIRLSKVINMRGV